MVTPGAAPTRAALPAFAPVGGSALPMPQSSGTRSVEAPSRAIGAGMTLLLFAFAGPLGLMAAHAANGRYREAVGSAGVPVGHAGRPGILDKLREGYNTPRAEEIAPVVEPDTRTPITGDGRGIGD